MSSNLTANQRLPKCGHEFWSNSDGDPQCKHCGLVAELCQHGNVLDWDYCEECNDVEQDSFETLGLRQSDFL